jgi:hypothetical protein
MTEEKIKDKLRHNVLQFERQKEIKRKTKWKS